MRRPPRAALRVVFLDYLAFYRTRWSEGQLAVCNEAAVTAPARRFLESRSCPSEGFRTFNVYSIAERCLQMKREPGGLVFGKLLRAFEFLELLCVNLFLSPWRKEIKSLKTFTGNFVYCMQSVLPNCVVEGLLEKIGYVATTPTEFSLVRTPSEEEAEQAAFEIFLARMECEDLLEIAKDVRDSDLGDILQKRAQKHWHPEHEVDGTRRTFCRKAYKLNRGEDQSPGYVCPQQTYLTGGGQPAFEKAEKPELAGEFSLAEPQPVVCFNSEQSSDESQATASTASYVRRTDSEDFLTKYSDIVIGQKPLPLTDLPLKASEDKSQATGLIRTTLGPPRKVIRAQTLLSPDASGPQALAILNDAPLEGKAVACDYGIQESYEETVESKIRDAMDCLSDCESYPMDQAKELRGESGIKQGNKLHIVMSLSREEGSYTSNPLKVKEDSEGELVYPIEETTQREYNRPQEFSLSGMDTPGGDEEDFSIDLYSSDGFTKNASPTTSSKYNRLLVGISSQHQTPECYRHTGESPNSTGSILPSGAEVQYPESVPVLQGRVNPEGHPLWSSFKDEITLQACTVKVNETNPEGYVLISKD